MAPCSLQRTPTKPPPEGRMEPNIFSFLFFSFFPQDNVPLCLCSPGCSKTCCLCFLSAGAKGMHHHAREWSLLHTPRLTTLRRHYHSGFWSMHHLDIARSHLLAFSVSRKKCLNGVGTVGRRCLWGCSDTSLILQLFSRPLF